jgi:hypothetical protein
MRVDLHLDGAPEEIDARSLEKALSYLISLLESLDDSSSSTPLPIIRLYTGSAGAVLDAPDYPGSLLAEGVPNLRLHHSLPQGWSEDSLNALDGLIGVGRNAHVDSIHLTADEQKILLDIELGEAIEEARQAMPTSMTSLRGRLYSYSNPERKATLIRIAPESGGKGVQVKVPNDLVPQVKNLLDKTVEIWGISKRHPETGLVTKMTLSGIEPIDTVTRLATRAATLRGIWSNNPQDGDSVQIVRRMRDEW